MSSGKIEQLDSNDVSDKKAEGVLTLGVSLKDAFSCSSSGSRYVPERSAIAWPFSWSSSSPSTASEPRRSPEEEGIDSTEELIGKMFNCKNHKRKCSFISGYRNEIEIAKQHTSSSNTRQLPQSARDKINRSLNLGTTSW